MVTIEPFEWRASWYRDLIYRWKTPSHSWLVTTNAANRRGPRESCTTNCVTLIVRKATSRVVIFYKIKANRTNHRVQKPIMTQPHPPQASQPGTRRTLLRESYTHSPKSPSVVVRMR